MLRGLKVTKSGYQPWQPPPPTSSSSPQQHQEASESLSPWVSHSTGLSRCHRGSLQEGHKPNLWHNLGVRLCLGIQKKRPGILASRSSWCLLEWQSEPAGWGRHNRGSNRVNLCISVSYQLFLSLLPAVLLKEGPFSLKSPPWLTSGWGCSVLGSFSFSVFLVSASKKPLPPTPEDNRVSETFSAGWEWAHCLIGTLPPAFLLHAPISQTLCEGTRLSCCSWTQHTGFLGPELSRGSVHVNGPLSC